MTLLSGQTVGTLVAENPARARVMEGHRIDYCCGGKIPLADACERRGVDLATVVREIEACDASSDSAPRDWTEAPLAELAEHIVETHHGYLRSELPRLAAMSARVAKVHGNRAREVLLIAEVFEALKRELEEHTKKEEQILFPWIARMEGGDLDGLVQAPSVANPIRCMEDDHDRAGAALDRLHELTGGYNSPEDACNTWRVLYASLEALEEDMHAHIHKENSILFPRALELERKLGLGAEG